MYFLLKMEIFQPAMLVYQRVAQPYPKIQVCSHDFFSHPRILDAIGMEHVIDVGRASKPEDVLLYTYTGGTTKHSKCVVVTSHGENFGVKTWDEGCSEWKGRDRQR